MFARMPAVDPFHPPGSSTGARVINLGDIEAADAHDSDGT